MTSEQVMLIAATLLLLCGCTGLRRHETPPLAAPFEARHVFAVLPVRNESGSLGPDSYVLADQIVRQLENTPNLDVLPVNRTLAAMQRLDVQAVGSPAEAMKLMAALGVDGLVAGSVTAWDPYDPPKVGMMLELYVSDTIKHGPAIDLRNLVSAPVAGYTRIEQHRTEQPVVTASGVFDAADPGDRALLERYAENRLPEPNFHASRLHRMSMDLFSEFVCHVMCQRVLHAEARRSPQPVTDATPR